MKKLINRIGTGLSNFVMALFSLTCIFPIIWITYSSLKTKEEFMLNIISPPRILHFDNYYTAFVGGKMYTYFFNSALNGIITVLLVIVLSFFIAYVLARYKFKGRNFIYTLFIVGMLIPVYALIVPLFIQFKTLGIYDKPGTLILPYTALKLPLSVFLFESFIKTIPIELDESAYMDGAHIFNTMRRIIFPVCLPMSSTILILTFLDTWNEFPFALVLITKEILRTLPVGLTNFYGQYTTNYTILMAALVLSILPIIIVYLFFNKKIIQGMTAGAVKG
jgi:raffinose/stachyose/melibiose transport system permease protein